MPTAPTAGKSSRAQRGDSACRPAQALRGLGASQGPAAAAACARTGAGHKSTLSATHAPLPRSTPHVFRSSNTPLRHPREAAGNPGHTSYCPHGGGVGCLVSEASVQVVTCAQVPALDFRGHRVGCVLDSQAGPWAGRHMGQGWASHPEVSVAPEPPGSWTVGTGPGGAHPSRLPHVQPLLLRGSRAGRREGRRGRRPEGPSDLPAGGAAASRHHPGAPIVSAPGSWSVVWGYRLPQRLQGGSREPTGQGPGGVP